MRMTLGLSCGLMIADDREGKRVLHVGRLMMEVPACMHESVRGKAGGSQNPRRPHAIKVVDACTSGKVYDEPRGSVAFTFVGDQPAQL